MTSAVGDHVLDDGGSHVEERLLQIELLEARTCG